ncbi:uncharacterized protein FFC1_15882 [Fusarium fujikuroi]|jgi:hypothetical protein
MYIK